MTQPRTRYSAYIEMQSRGLLARRCHDLIREHMVVHVQGWIESVRKIKGGEPIWDARIRLTDIAQSYDRQSRREWLPLPNPRWEQVDKDELI